MKSKSLFLSIIIVLSGLVSIHPQKVIDVAIREGVSRIPIAIPEFIVQTQSPEMIEAAKTLREVFTADMKYSRIFIPLLENYYDHIDGLNPDNIQFKDWESIQAKLLIVGEVRQGEDGKFIFSANVYDVKSKNQIFGRNLSGKNDVLRFAAHRMSDFMMQHYGEPQIFNTKIIFVSNRDGNEEIYWMDYDGHNQTRLTFSKNVLDYMPAWAPDGRSFAYISYEGSAAVLSILNPYTGKKINVENKATNSAPCFSPNGKKLAYASTKIPGNTEIYVYDLARKKSKRITFNKGSDTAPTWSPQGRQIAFTSDRQGLGAPQIYTMDAEGGNLRRISFGGSYFDAPVWSPDGSRIAFVSRVNQVFDIYILNMQTGKYTKLTESNARNESPCWSLDGRHLIISSTREGKTQLYSIDYDGKNVKRLTSQGDNKLPDWSN